VPTYEYECKNCLKIFDIRQSINDPTLTECPECQSKSLIKKISIPTVFTSRKNTVVQKKLSSIGGSSVFTPPLNWRANLLGVRPDDKASSKS
jgi:putative FmdB family regulatory protein